MRNHVIVSLVIIMEQKRFENIDICKGILIIIVVLIHGLALTSARDSYIHRFNSAFVMPAFFVLSSILYNHEKWQRKGFLAFLIHRIQTLIIPYFFFDLTGGAIVQIALGNWCGLSFSGLLRECMRLLYHSLTLDFNLVSNWFLPALFFAELLLYAAMSLRKHGPIYIYIFSAFCLCTGRRIYPLGYSR